MTEAHDLAVTLRSLLPKHTYQALLRRVTRESPEDRLRTLRYVAGEWDRAQASLNTGR